MREWNQPVQAMIDWLERHLTEPFTLEQLARQVGYSPNYCSRMFHNVVGVTLKRYTAGRRLCRAAMDIRDSQRRIVDIALEYGFSSQQALTKAFVYAYGCTPAAYRRQPRPIAIAPQRAVLFPADFPQQEEAIMSKTILTEPGVRVVHIPAHQYLCVRDSAVQAYFPFFETHDCDRICGLVESMSHVAHPMVPCHTAGWFWQGGTRGYSYGVGVDTAYDGPVPEGFEAWRYPGSYYLAFTHPPFDFLRDSETVVNRVEELAWSFDPAPRGFAWNEALCQDYQRMDPEGLGYEVLRPVQQV